MKNIVTLSLLTLAFVSCEKKQEAKPEKVKIAYAVFGDSISTDGAITSAEMMDKFKTLKESRSREAEIKRMKREEKLALAKFI